MISIRIALVLIFAAVAAAGSDLTAIQDNSFLAEEAYNQEKGVVQHINLFTRDRTSGDWTHTFTQEWTVRSQTPQLSRTIPIGVGPSAGSQSIIAYLGFEHPFVR